MPYMIAQESFDDKEQIKNRCREVLAATQDGHPVDLAHKPFLFALFQHHTEWEEKAAAGVVDFTVKRTPHGTRCFFLIMPDGGSVDISYPHAVKHIPSPRTQNLLPQRLLDFRAAARAAVAKQIYDFRGVQLARGIHCPISNVLITRDDYAVDHEPPLTFDRLLFQFCTERGLNPLIVEVHSVDGTDAHISDVTLRDAWYDHHATHARLRLLTRAANLKLPKEKVPWKSLWM
jgi:hypothetical protein